MLDRAPRRHFHIFDGASFPEAELAIDGNLTDARNAAFSVLVTAEILRSFGARSDTRPVWELGLFSNFRLFVIATTSFCLQLVIHHLRALESVFGTEPISLGQCMAWIALGLVPLVVFEVLKLRRHREGRGAAGDAVELCAGP